MKLNCENCVKRDVCAHMLTSQELCKKLSLSREFQDLQRRNINLNITCNSYLAEQQNTIYVKRGEE